MDFTSESVLGFFGRAKVMYTIPDYQRAYSWDEPQLKTFLEDLTEHRNGSQDNPYCYGNILLETIIKDREYEIVDGQQRITTISIFMRALLNVLTEKQLAADSKLRKSDGETLNITDEEAIYFKNCGIIKLHLASDDQPCFEILIVENDDSFTCSTPSQKRILFAKNYFVREFERARRRTACANFRNVTGCDY